MPPYEASERKQENINTTTTGDQMAYNDIDHGFQDDEDDSKGDTYIYIFRL